MRLDINFFQLMGTLMKRHIPGMSCLLLLFVLPILAAPTKADQQDKKQKKEYAPVDKEVPDIEGEDLDGKAFKLSDYRGKVVLLAFWGNWCPDCRAMYPHERSLVKRMENRPFALIGVNSDKDKAVLKKALEKEEITWRSFWDGGSTKGPISTKWQVRGWPTLYIIDHMGVVRVSYALGRSPGQEPLDEWIDRLVKEAEKKN
jgi:thiol-disulfide isomerase/thioredoxin